jgi:hypothetical protein
VLIGTDAPGIVAYARVRVNDFNSAGVTVGPVANLVAYGCPPSMAAAWSANTRGEGPDDPSDEPRPDNNPNTPSPRIVPRP